MMITDKPFGLIETVELANINHTEVVLHQSDNMRTVAHGKVEVDDAETVGETIHE